MPVLEEEEISLTQFNRLVNELLRGTLNRNCFRPWEIGLMLEIENCNLRPSARRDLLRRYQKAVQRHFENRTGPPPTLSDYLEALQARRARNGSPPHPPAPATPELS